MALSTTNRLPKIRRADPEQLPPFTLGESHRTMLRLLHHYRYLTAPLLALAYSQERGRGRSHVENELGKLYHRGYVERHYYSTRPTGYGSDAFVYALAPKGGHEILDEAGKYGNARLALYNRAKPKENYKHHLAVSTLQLILELGAGPWTLEAFYGDDDEATKFEATVEHRKRHYYPDALAVLRFPNGKRAGYFFELDLAHKNQQRLDARFLGYAQHLTEHREVLCRKHELSGAVAVIVSANDHERERTGQRAIKSLAGKNRDARRRFLFWTLDSWYSGSGKDRRLKEPREILGQENVADAAANWRQLVNIANH